LCWVFTLLALHPDKESKARAECEAALKNSNGKVTWDTLGELRFTTAVIHETLRLYSTVPNLASRNTLSDDHVPMSDGKSVFLPKVHSHTTYSVVHCN